MMIARTSKSVVQRPIWVRTCAASPWGGDKWRYDKNAFAQWCKESVAPGPSKAKREMYGFLGIAFGDVDANKDGFIDHKEFDLLCEKVASLPRRFGFAPSWEKEYGGDVEKRRAARKAQFDALDTRNGPARHVLGLKQFTRWASDHIIQKVATIDLKSKVDFYHIEDYDETTFLNYLEHALNNPQSSAFASFYEFMLSIFIEADVDCMGQITREQIDILLDRAAHVPRVFGLAPSSGTKEHRDKIFASMDENNEGYVTFRKFLAWTVDHTKLKIKMQKAGEGYKK
jgi:hypothetical protein